MNVLLLRIAQHPLIQVLRNRNLIMLWIGEGFSVLGSQFYLIALPWLVLQVTGDTFQMGIVLALAGIPRALFMLVGGAFTDKFDPKVMMIASNIIRMTVGIYLAFLVYHNQVEKILLYLLSLIFGLADAFLYPAQSAILPKIVKPEFLLAGNSIVQGTAQLSIAVGPALAGIVIAVFSRESANSAVLNDAMDMFGIAVAFMINASAFFISILFFLTIRLSNPANSPGTSENRGMLGLLWEGILYVIGDKTLIYMLFVAAFNHFLVEGPLFIGVPVLSNSRFTQGAAAFGIIMSGLGAGMLTGIAVAGLLPALNPKRMGGILMSLLSLSGLGLIILGFMNNTYLAALVVMLMGLAQGFVIVQFSTWMQLRAPSHLLGRVLSMMMFASVGLVPVSQALCGLLIKFSVTGLFVGAGIVVVVLNLVMSFRREIRRMGLYSEPKKPTGIA